MKNKYTIFDVGAHGGGPLIYQYEPSEVHIYGFEPQKDIIKTQLKRNIKLQEFEDSYTIINRCVDVVEEEKTMYIGSRCKGQTSLYASPFFPQDGTFKIKSIRLDTFIKKNKIKKIDFLHIDCQGNDLNVLRSLGDYIEIVRTGMLEVAKPNKNLYDGESKYDDVIQFLQSNNFNVICEHPVGHEINIFFEYIDLEISLDA